MQHNSLENIFKSGQIVCLESDKSSLYGEVIQVITQRQLCWVRPLTITITSEDNRNHFAVNSKQEMIDLRSAADLLLPLTLFRASYDTEVIFFLTELAKREQSLDKQQISFYLNNFVQQVWQENPEKFSK